MLRTRLLKKLVHFNFTSSSSNSLFFAFFHSLGYFAPPTSSVLQLQISPLSTSSSPHTSPPPPHRTLLPSSSSPLTGTTAGASGSAAITASCFCWLLGCKRWCQRQQVMEGMKIVGNKYIWSPTDVYQLMIILVDLLSHWWGEVSDGDVKIDLLDNGDGDW